MKINKSTRNLAWLCMASWWLALGSFLVSQEDQYHGEGSMLNCLVIHDSYASEGLFVQQSDEPEEPVGACVVETDEPPGYVCFDDVGEDKCKHDVRHGGSFHPNKTCEDLFPI